MRRTRGRVVVVDSVADFDARLAAGARSLSGWHLRGLDLSARSAELRALDPGGALFLGCRFAPGLTADLRAAGAMVVAAPADTPIDPDRQALYTPRELYDAPPYAQSPGCCDQANALASSSRAIGNPGWPRRCTITPSTKR